jgi:hypothetical protein
LTFASGDFPAAENEPLTAGMACLHNRLSVVEYRVAKQDEAELEIGDIQRLATFLSFD